MCNNRRSPDSPRGFRARLPSRRLGVRETDNRIIVQYRSLMAGFTAYNRGVTSIHAVPVEVASAIEKAGVSAIEGEFINTFNFSTNL